uniref:Uncharacterized protein n=1 Tax=Pipistrellus kuhlii TaxID=59472 RepID=A0A7J8A9J0_PIPKU|nr:hypothetical protein mPipKuh1_008992 [Pipistrellus kuhlii]
MACHPKLQAKTQFRESNFKWGRVVAGGGKRQGLRGWNNVKQCSQILHPPVSWLTLGCFLPPAPVSLHPPQSQRLAGQLTAWSPLWCCQQGFFIRVDTSPPYTPSSPPPPKKKISITHCLACK